VNGAAASLVQVWELSRRWYGDRLDRSFRPRSVAESQQMLADAGLTSSFWRLAP
jgi:hypothetical protein